MEKQRLAGDIRKYYNELMGNVKGEYVSYRWSNSEIKRRHYHQTAMALRNALGKIDDIGEVLEIGCGPAVWTPLYFERAKRVTLWDISEEMLRYARKRMGDARRIAYVRGDFEDPDACCDMNYDLIISVRTWEYLSDKKKAVERCYDLLKPRGRLVIVTKNADWLDNRRRLRIGETVNGSEMPIREAMQMNLLRWQGLMAIFGQNGLINVETYPVVIGSYGRLVRWNVGLIGCEVLHRFVYRYRISEWYKWLVESYLTTGVKPY